MAEKPKTLWIGDLENYMDEDFVRKLFGSDAQYIVSVKIMRDKTSGLASGYGFLETDSYETANRILNSYSGKPIPSLPGRIYRLNWSALSVGGERRTDPNPHHAVFVGDIAPEVNDYTLFVSSMFKTRIELILLASFSATISFCL
jgi:hypothetical protein